MTGLKWCRIPWNYLMGPHSSEVLELSKSNQKQPAKTRTFFFSWWEEIRMRKPPTYNGKKHRAQISQVRTQGKDWIERGQKHLSSLLLSLSLFGFFFFLIMFFTVCHVYNLKLGHLSFFDGCVQIFVVISVLAVRSWVLCRCACCTLLFFKEKYLQNETKTTAKHNTETIFYYLGCKVI